VSAIAEGSAPIEAVRVFAKELYFLGRVMIPEFALLVANSPDADANGSANGAHYRYWLDHFADEAGWGEEADHLELKLLWCRALGIGEDELVRYVPLPETIGMVYTLLYYVRRSYEEGLACLGYAAGRTAVDGGYAASLHEGMRRHYGMEVEDLAVHAETNPARAEKAERCLREVAVTEHVQKRIVTAVRNYVITHDMRKRALNRVLAEQG
jgi:pyrroloquinoline quinone (PQQ) biosynthesis protein C